MPMKRYKPEQIFALLRQIEVEMANGKTTPPACEEAEIARETFYRWREELVGFGLDQAERLRELEKENTQPISQKRPACSNLLIQLVIQRPTFRPTAIHEWEAT